MFPLSSLVTDLFYYKYGTFFFTSTIRNKSYAVYTPPASISLAICRWCDICIFNVRNKDVVVVVVVVDLFHDFTYFLHTYDQRPIYVLQHVECWVVR